MTSKWITIVTDGKEEYIYKSVMAESKEEAECVVRNQHIEKHNYTGNPYDLVMFTCRMAA